MNEKMINLTDKQCPVNELMEYAKAHKCADCGKCVFGYEGAAQLEMTMADIANKRSRASDMEQLKKLCNMMAEQSLCDDGIELAQTALAMLDKYADDFAAHIAKKACKAGVCKKFVTYHILPDLCIGCGDCMDECEDDAIMGKKKFIHVIDQSECTQCGKCVSACDEEAIVMAGAVKPRGPLKPVPCKK